jgi:hypothetical protein
MQRQNRRLGLAISENTIQQDFPKVLALHSRNNALAQAKIECIWQNQHNPIMLIQGMNGN